MSVDCYFAKYTVDTIDKYLKEQTMDYRTGYKTIAIPKELTKHYNTCIITSLLIGACRNPELNIEVSCTLKPESYAEFKVSNELYNNLVSLAKEYNTDLKDITNKILMQEIRDEVYNVGFSVPKPIC